MRVPPDAEEFVVSGTTCCDVPGETEGPRDAELRESMHRRKRLDPAMVEDLRNSAAASAAAPFLR